MSEECLIVDGESLFVEQVAEYVCATFEINSSWAPYIERAGERQRQRV